MSRTLPHRPDGVAACFSGTLDGFTPSSKVGRAVTLAAKGQHIEIIDEIEFLRLINLEPADY
jgi:hypothetical protein